MATLLRWFSYFSKVFSPGLEHPTIFKILLHSHCVKSVRIRSYSGPYFPAFGLNTEGYEVSFRVQSKCGKIQIRITPTKDTFYAVSLISNLLTASSKKLQEVCAILLSSEITISFSIRVIPVELIFSRMFCYFININSKQTSIFKILISQLRLFFIIALLNVLAI